MFGQKRSIVAMTIPPLLGMALITGMTHTEAATILHSYLNHNLSETAISSTNTASRKCDCRRLCMEDETCTAVTASGTGEDVMCVFSRTLQPVMTSAVTGAITYVKSLPCEAPYEMVKGVGCLWVSDYRVSFSTAKTSCPKNAGVTRLASPVTDAIYVTMTRHIMAKSDLSPSWYWYGLERIGGEWLWPDGHSIPNTVGSSLWGRLDPNENSDCATTYFHGLYFTLVDTICSREHLFVCEMR